MKKSYLYAVVSVSGASVLAVEVLGTRIVGPFFGVSIFLWSALISVTLAALALGYWLGGRWADAGPSPARLGFMLAAAGIWLVLLPVMRITVTGFSRHLGHLTALVLSSFILFFAPLAILGMVSPYALKLRAESVEEVGRSAGDLYAVSTLASVAAALAMGFFLIPNFGVKVLTAAIGVVLVAAGSAVFLGNRKTLRHGGRGV